MASPQSSTTKEDGDHFAPPTEEFATTVAVIGGGYAGMSCATKLANSGIDVCLVNKEGSFVEWPLLPDTLSRRPDSGRIYHSWRSLHKIPVLKRIASTVKKIEVANKSLILDTDTQIKWEYLVCAWGNQQEKIVVPKNKSVYNIYSRDDQERLIHLLSEEAFDRRPHVALVGITPLSIQLAFALRSIFNQSKLRIELFGREKILSSQLPGHVCTALEKELHDATIHVKLNETCSIKDKKIISSSKALSHDVILLCEPVNSKPIDNANAALPLNNGQLVVNRFLQVERFPQVYGAGTAICLHHSNIADNPWCHIVQGHAAAQNISNKINKHKLIAYEPHPIPWRLWTGKSKAVSQFGSKSVLTGLPGYAMWRRQAREIHNVVQGKR